jgi:hypothetical protein
VTDDVEYRRETLALTISPEAFDDLTRRVAEAGGMLRAGFPSWLAPLLTRGTIAITLGRRIYLGGELLRAADVEVAAIVAHELEHVRQFARVGPARFAWQYLRDYARNRRRGMSAFAAYEAIPFEVEARREETRFRSANGRRADVESA